jgi:hypothetical protein
LKEAVHHSILGDPISATGHSRLIRPFLLLVNVRFDPIVLQKSFCTGAQKF